jgi:hypothetical protein
VPHAKRRVLRVSALHVVACAQLALAAAACGAPGKASRTAQASDEWTRSYSLAPSGEIQILNTSGSVDVETGPGPDVQVHAERVAHATSDQLARDLLTRIEIREAAQPDRVTLETKRIDGVLIGVSWEVNYRVRVPASASVRVRASNGTVRATGIGGKASLTSTNGNIVGRALGGTVEARATNGSADVEIVNGTRDFVDVRAVNGRVDLAVPKSLDANLSATAVNGRVQIADLPFENFGDAVRDTRRVRGRLNAGGFPIELNATNGSVNVRGHE